MTDPTGDLNNVITSAVNARIETAVLEALSGDQFFGRLVAVALQREISVRDSSGYRDRKTTFLAHVLESTIRQATEDAARRLVLEQADDIEEAVRKELRRSSSEIAKQLVGAVTEKAKETYGIKVELQFPGRY